MKENVSPPILKKLILWVLTSSLALGALLSTSPLMAASRFYLTVERSFSNEERPKFRLDFVDDKKPLKIRVLRAKNLEGFLDGQLNISRAYEEPLSDINSGHYLVKGLNQVSSPLAILRDSLSIDFRKNFGGNEFNNPLPPKASDELAAAPQEVTLGPPRGFEQVREVFIDLQKGGAPTSGLYEDWWGEESYQIRNLDLDPLPDGVYLLQALQEKYEAQALLQVSSLSIQVKQSGAQLVVRAIDRKGAAVSKLKASYRDGRGTWRDITGVTNASGELVLNNAEGLLDSRLVVRVQDDAGRTALTSTDFLLSSQAGDAVFLLTDRPIFKPGDEFSYKGILRQVKDGVVSSPKVSGEQGTVTVVRSDGTETELSESVTLSKHDSFSGSFTLDEAQTPGLYKVVSSVHEKTFAGELRVRDYIKPTFYLELGARDAAIKPGEPFNFELNARRFAGGVPQGVKYEVFIYRKRFEAPQWVEESGGGLTAGDDYFGEVRTSTALTQPQRIYSSVEERFGKDGSADQDPWSSAATFDDSGSAKVTVVVPQVPAKDLEQDWIYTIVVRSQDARGSQANLSENVSVTQSEAIPSLRFKHAVVADNKEPIELIVGAFRPDGGTAAKAKGSIEVMAEGNERPIGVYDFVTADDGRAVVSLPAGTPSGRLSARATLKSIDGVEFKRVAQSETAQCVVASSEGATLVQNSQLELVTDSSVLAPGDHARVLALLPIGWGSGNDHGTVWETVSGAKIFSTSARDFTGRSSWFDVEAKAEYGTGFYHTITVPVAAGKYQERTLSFRVVPLDKRLSIQITPEAEIAEPLKPFTIKMSVNDALGKPAADTELAVSIVDRAVYSVQPEFRPHIVEFFYPLARLNVGTFYSDDLQGYGYADQLKQPNFRMAALKSRSQPQKRDMRDTAGWFPHVVTDSKGYAEVNAQMPANLTQWVVTVVAADKDTRVGEARAMFRSATDLSVEPQIPLFMRTGDSVTATLGYSNSTKEALQVSANLSSSGALDIAGADTAKSLKLEGVALPAGGESTTPLILNAAQVAAGGLLTLATESVPQSRSGGERNYDLEVHSSDLLQTVVAHPAGLGFLSFDPVKDASVKQIKVRVVNGLLGAALAAGAELVSYPYGCTEQLVHTTIPNLLLLDILAKANLPADQLSALGLTKAAEKARQNAELGLKKILANQKKDGGFSLWPSEAEADVTTSVIAARALRLAVELNLGNASSALSRTTSWVSEQVKKPGPAGLSEAKLLRAFELEKLVQAGADYEIIDQLAEFLQEVADKPEAAAFGELVSALNIYSLVESRYWIQEKINRPQLKQMLASAVSTRLKALNMEQYTHEVAEDFEQLGFSYGQPLVLASALGALNAAGALDDATRASVSARLTEQLQRGWWGSTFDSGEVIFALRGLLEKEAGEQKAEKRKISVVSADGSAIGELQSFPGGAAATLSFKGEIQPIRLSDVRSGDYAFATAQLEVPLASVKPVNNGLAVERELLKIATSGTTALTGSGAAQPLHVGDVVVSAVKVTRSDAWGEGRAPSEFIVIEDPVPALAEAIESDREYLADAKLVTDQPTYWGSVRDTIRYPDKTVRILKLAPGASYTMYQVWRVGFSGAVALPATTAFDMYNDALSGNSAAAQVLVK